MGINLTPVVVRHPINLEALRGKLLAVDAPTELYQFLALIRGPDGTPLQDRQGRITSHLVGLMFRTTRLVFEYDIRPVFVFDGAPPPLKQRVLAARAAAKAQAQRQYSEARQAGDWRRAWSKAVMTAHLSAPLIADAKRLLTVLGLPYVEAPSEAEAQAAHMAQRQSVWAAASKDYDALLFGAPRLARFVSIGGTEFLPSKGGARPVEPEVIHLDECLACWGVTREQLVDAAILVGTDFAPGIKGIGPKGALALVRKHKHLEGLPSELRAQLPAHYPEVRNFFLHPPVRDDYAVTYGEPDEAELQRFLVDDHDFSPERVRVVVERMRRVKARGAQTALSRWMG
jgi:flap endonuclease-1